MALKAVTKNHKRSENECQDVNQFRVPAAMIFTGCGFNENTQ